MKVNERKRYEMLVRVRDYGIVHRDLFPRSGKGGKAFTQIAAAVEALSGEAAAQLNGRGVTHEATDGVERARNALRESLAAMSATARAVAIDRPGLDRKFRLPHGAGNRALLDAAQAFVNEAASAKDDFVAHDLPRNFLAELKARMADVEEAITEQQSGKDAHASATVGIADALASGMEAVRRLDAIVRNRLRDDAQARVVWARARRIGDPRCTPRAAEAGTPPVPPEPSSPTPAAPTPAAPTPPVPSSAST